MNNITCTIYALAGPENVKAFGGGGETLLHPLTWACLLAATVAIWVLPRRQLIIPFLLATVLIPPWDQIVVAGIHFPVIRIVITLAWLRLLSTLKRHQLTLLDRVFICWVIVNAITYTILWADIGALIDKLGFAFNAFGIYFLLRQLIRDRASVTRLLRTFAIISVVVACIMAFQAITGDSWLSAIGGPALVEVRQGRIRAQGPFVHSIIAGTFGAILLPSFVGLYCLKGKRTCAVAGIVASTVIVVTSASSTPISAAIAGIVAFCFWPLRYHMRAVRWSFAALLVILQITMKAPVWSLINRVDVVAGSSGWHRYMLVDECIRHLGEWWLTGTTANDSWGPDMWDKANWYVASALTGGLATFILFVAVIAAAFRGIGIARRKCVTKDDQLFAWSLGAALFAAALAFLGINLIDQSITVWYALLATVSLLSSSGVALSNGRPLASACISTPVEQREVEVGR